jgi:hypothetical protein
MAIDCRTAGSTVNDALLEPIDPSEAEILVLPTPVAVASPVAPSVATEGAEEVHVTNVDRFCVVPFVYLPVAVNCCVVPMRIEELAGVTEIESKAAGETVRFVWPDTLPSAASIVVLPIACEVAEPAPLTVAMLVLPEDQVTVVVRF